MGSTAMLHCAALCSAVQQWCAVVSLHSGSHSTPSCHNFGNKRSQCKVGRRETPSKERGEA
eukprot:3740954-Rhodomonas_salina.1